MRWQISDCRVQGELQITHKLQSALFPLHSRCHDFPSSTTSASITSPPPGCEPLGRSAAPLPWPALPAPASLDSSDFLSASVATSIARRSSAVSLSPLSLAKRSAAYTA